MDGEEGKGVRGDRGELWMGERKEAEGSKRAVSDTAAER